MNKPEIHAECFTTPLLILGLGNELRGDDAAAWQVVRTVEKWNCPGVRTLCCRQLSPELVEEFALVSTVLIVDADVTLTEPGMDQYPVTAQHLLPRNRLIRLQQVSITKENKREPFSHHVSAAWLVRLMHQLFGYAPGVWLLGIAAESFEFGSLPSHRCQAGIRTAIEVLYSLLPEQYRVFSSFTFPFLSYYRG